MASYLMSHHWYINLPDGLLSSYSYVVTGDFDQAASYTLENLKNPDMKLKPEQVKATKHVYEWKDIVWFSTQFGKSICYLWCSAITKAESWRRLTYQSSHYETTVNSYWYCSKQMTLYMSPALCLFHLYYIFMRYSSTNCTHAHKWN